MIDSRFFDELGRRIGEGLPPGLQHLRRDLERNARAAIQAAFERLDLVSREEFEIQSKVLARTREKLEALEARVRRLEEEAKGADEPSGSPSLPEPLETDTEIDMDGG